MTDVAEQTARAIWHHAQTAPERPLSREQLAALEVDGCDPTVEAAYYPDYYGDIAAAEAEDRYERQSERALEWLERGA
jgi:hypothetical protein